MGLFTKDQEIKQIPRTEGSKTGEQILTQIAGQTPDIPQQGVAGLTPIQMAIQGMLGGTLGRVAEGSTAAQDYYKGVLGSDADLENDPRYQTLMQQSDILTRKASTEAKRGSERMGMLDSSGGDEAQMTAIQKAQSPILQAIGSLLTQKENEKMNAAEGVGRAGGQEVSNIAAVGGIAERGYEFLRQQADALYNQLILQMTAPYKLQAGIADSLMNFKPDYAVTGGGMTDLGFGLNVGAQAFGAAVGSMVPKPKA